MSTNVGQRHVADTPQNRTLNAVDMAKKLALHTSRICKNQKVFSPEYSVEIYVIRKTAMDIYAMAYDANNIVVKKDSVDYQKNVEDRLKEQMLCVRKCSDLLGYIDFAKPLFHLRKGKVAHWTGLTLQTRSYLHKWHESDVRRFRN